MQRKKEIDDHLSFKIITSDQAMQIPTLIKGFAKARLNYLVKS
jgi:hypothetical protein